MIKALKNTAKTDGATFLLDVVGVVSLAVLLVGALHLPALV